MSSRSLPLLAWLMALFLAPPIATSAEPLGRLFFSPEQRVALDQQRWEEPENGEPQENTIRFDGVVLRSSGRNTYWLNGKTQNEKRRAIAEIVPGNSKTAPEARVPMPGAPIRIRIGEAVNPSSGEKRALLSDDALVIHRSQRQ